MWKGAFGAFIRPGKISTFPFLQWRAATRHQFLKCSSGKRQCSIWTGIVTQAVEAKTRLKVSLPWAWPRPKTVFFWPSWIQDGAHLWPYFSSVPNKNNKQWRHRHAWPSLVMSRELSWPSYSRDLISLATSRDLDLTCDVTWPRSRSSGSRDPWPVTSRDPWPDLWPLTSWEVRGQPPIK